MLVTPTQTLHPDLAKKDAESRYRFSMVVAVQVMDQLSPEGRVRLIAAGEKAFVRSPAVRDLASRQDLRMEDLQRIFQAIQWAVTHNRPPLAILGDQFA